MDGFGYYSLREFFQIYVYPVSYICACVAAIKMIHVAHLKVLIYTVELVFPAFLL